MEGLAFGSPSSVIDLIAANHWMVRCSIKNSFPKINWTIIPPKSWQKSIITKDILAILAKDYPVTRAKRGMKLTKEEKQTNTKSKAEIRKKTKEIIKNSVPKEITKEFELYIEKNKLHKDSIYDLCDAYFLAKYIQGKK